MWLSSFLPIRHCYGRVSAHGAMSHLINRLFNSLESRPDSGRDVYLREKSNPACTRSVEAAMFVECRL